MKKYICILVGIPFGLVMLFISYICVNYYVSEDLFKSEILNADNLVFQMLAAEFFYILLFKVLETMTMNLRNIKVEPKYNVDIILICVLTLGIAIVVVKQFGHFNEIVEEVFLGLGILIFMIISVSSSIINAINIKKINKKLMERNSQKVGD